MPLNDKQKAGARMAYYRQLERAGKNLTQRQRKAVDDIKARFPDIRDAAEVDAIKAQKQAAQAPDKPFHNTNADKVRVRQNLFYYKKLERSGATLTQKQQAAYEALKIRYDNVMNNKESGARRSARVKDMSEEEATEHKRNYYRGKRQKKGSKEGKNNVINDNNDNDNDNVASNKASSSSSDKKPDATPSGL